MISAQSAIEEARALCERAIFRWERESKPVPNILAVHDFPKDLSPVHSRIHESWGLHERGSREYFVEYGDGILEFARQNPKAQLKALLGFSATGEEVTSWAELLMGSPSGTDGPHCGDVLTYGFSGYWLQGWARCGDRGWFCIDQEEFNGDIADSVADANEVLEEMAARFTSGDLSREELGDDLYILGAPEALISLKWGRERHGVGFDDGTCDYGDNDCGVQVALLGEVVYG